MTWVRDNSLTIALMALFAVSLIGQAVAGWQTAMEEARQHGEAAEGLWAYVRGGEFLSALFENWESEFLQMAVYVVLTAQLFQRGSAESRDPDDPGRPNDEPQPGLLGVVYAHSLGLALTLLFLGSFWLHAINSVRRAEEEALRHGEAPPGFVEHLGSAQFWFESFQNWQSEFLSTAVLVVLSIYLRERGSPESKAVRDPIAKTGAN